MGENSFSWTTKTDAGKFPQGTYHTKFVNPYGVGYEGTIHGYKIPGQSIAGHIDYPRK